MEIASEITNEIVNNGEATDVIETFETLSVNNSNTKEEEEEKPRKIYNQKILLPDGQRIGIVEELVKYSVLISVTIEDDDDDSTDIDIPMSQKEEDVVKCIEFCQKYIKDPFEIETDKPLTTPNLIDRVPQWAVDFVDLSVPKICDLARTSNYLAIQPLVDLVCMKLASMARCKTPDELRQTFGIEKDFSQEEKDEFQAQHAELFQ